MIQLSNLYQKIFNIYSVGRYVRPSVQQICSIDVYIDNYLPFFFNDLFSASKLFSATFYDPTERLNRWGDTVLSPSGVLL